MTSNTISKMFPVTLTLIVFVLPAIAMQSTKPSPKLAKRLVAPSTEERILFRDKYSHHPILKPAIAIMDGVDVTVEKDINLLLNYIQESLFALNKEDILDSSDKEAILEKMAFDNDIVIFAAENFDTFGTPERVFRPFLDLLFALGSDTLFKGQKGRNGITHAMNLITKYDQFLFRGDLPEELRVVQDIQNLYLRIALMYVVKHLQNSHRNVRKDKEISFADLKSFYPSNDDHRKFITSNLEKTLFAEGGKLYAPSNGYIKNADLCHVTGLSLPGTEEAALMVFTDCSGFAQFIARLLHPDHDLLKTKRYMSYHLAPLFDILANAKMETQGLYYGVGTDTRELSSKELAQMKLVKNTIASLDTVYEPVINPLKNLLPGDIIVKRGSKEGHVVIVVEQSLTDKSVITVVELASGPNKAGYFWNKIRLKSGTPEEIHHRVLRIKQS